MSGVCVGEITRIFSAPEAWGSTQGLLPHSPTSQLCL